MYDLGLIGRHSVNRSGSKFHAIVMTDFRESWTAFLSSVELLSYLSFVLSACYFSELLAKSILGHQFSKVCLPHLNSREKPT